MVRGHQPLEQGKTRSLPLRRPVPILVLSSGGSAEGGDALPRRPVIPADDPAIRAILIAWRPFGGLQEFTIMSDGMRIKDLPENERPRERLAELGAQALRDAELIAILLRTGTKGRSAVQIAEELLQKFHTLNALARASLEDLQIKGIGRDKAIALQSAFTLAARMAREMQGEAPHARHPGTGGRLSAG